MGKCKLPLVQINSAVIVAFPSSKHLQCQILLSLSQATPSTAAWNDSKRFIIKLQLHLKSSGRSSNNHSCMRQLLASASFTNAVQGGLGPVYFNPAQSYMNKVDFLQTQDIHLCKFSTLLKHHSKCQARLPTIAASFTAPAAPRLPTYHPISMAENASVACLSLVHHCPIMGSISSCGDVSGMRRMTLNMVIMASGITRVFRVRS